MYTVQLEYIRYFSYWMILKKDMYLDADFGVVPLDLEAEEGIGGGRT